MKPRTAVFCLIAFSMLICAAQALEHLIHAQALRTALSMPRVNDLDIARAQETLRSDYRVVEACIAVTAAQGILIFLLTRRDHGTPVA
jgi:hypothetical protein